MFFSPKLNSTAKNVYDVVIVGGGIVGCATARQLKLSKPNLRAVLVEKEAKLAAHQSGHNSGVLHSGIYYVPGSLKARLCVKGIDMAYKFCDEKSIPYKKCGKLIVALNEGEIGGLENLFDRSQKNNCRDISVVDAKRIREIEPHCQGIKAIWSPHTGIVDWAVVTLKMAEDFKQMGGDIELGWSLNKIEESSNPQTPIKLIDSKGKEVLNFLGKNLLGEYF
uniref:L-2-hydroxyglutarate dehydrogenase, mitochondrial n=1 Tax=Meloidogyne incognita TaxID=6306 RepID=A0A914NKU1_MELIC